MAKDPRFMSSAELEAAKRAKLDALQALQPRRDKPAPVAKPTMADNYVTLGNAMARGAQRMVEQRRIIAEPAKKPAKR